MINQENWTFCQYKSLNSKVFISISGVPSDQKEQEEVEFLYSVTVTDLENKQISQKDFKLIDLALDEVNDRFGHWKFENLEVVDNSSDSGCGSCQAH